MPAAIAIASILQESNNFSPVQTRYEDFSPVFGDAVIERHRGKLTEMGGFIDVLTTAGMRIEPVCAAWARPTGWWAPDWVGRASRSWS